MKIELGKTVLTCHKTGKQFIAQREGITVNYAKDGKGNYYSNEGVYLSLKDDVLNNSIIGLYADLENKTVTGWKSEHLMGKIICHYTRHSGFCGVLDYIEVRMFDGSLWKGKYNSRSMQCVTLRKAS